MKALLRKIFPPIKLIVKEGDIPPAYGLGYTDMTNKVGVFYIFPIFVLVRIGRFLFFLWNKFRCNPTWFDKQMKEAAKIGFAMGRDQLLKDKQAQRISKRYMRDLELVNKNNINKNLN